MKRILLRVFAVLVLVVIAIPVTLQIRFSKACKRVYNPAPFTLAAEVAAADVALGRRLYEVRSGCVDCHGKDGAGARIMENGAMGHIHGANITPANLKAWSDEEIARAIRYGVHKTGRSLRFMPSFDYATLSKGDIAALVAYLRTLAPVEKPSHENTFGPIAKMLSVMGKMPVMFPAAAMDLTLGFAEKPAEGPTPEFGRYLANACTGCHGAEFRGGPIPGGDPSWPPAPSIRLGAAPVWTEATFRACIKDGVSPVTHQALRPPMPVALLQQMNDVELQALWTFLSGLK